MVTTMEIKIQALKEGVNLPSYAHPGDAGLDLYSLEDKVLKPGERYAFSLGFALELPEGFVSLIKDRSSMAFKFGIHSMAGVIDSGYRGEYKVVLVNLGEEDHTVEKGDKIAQLLIMPVEHAKIKVVKELSKTNRGEGGFGASGRK